VVDARSVQPGDRITVEGLVLTAPETVLTVLERLRWPGDGVRIIYEGIDRGDEVGGAFTIGGDLGYDPAAITIHRL
jgi:hypothetical protein